MTNTIAKLTAAQVVDGLRQIHKEQNHEPTTERFLATCLLFLDQTEYADEDEFRNALVKAITEWDFIADCLKTIHADIQTFYAGVMRQ